MHFITGLRGNGPAQPANEPRSAAGPMHYVCTSQHLRLPDGRHDIVDQQPDNGVLIGCVGASNDAHAPRHGGVTLCAHARMLQYRKSLGLRARGQMVVD